MKTKSKRFAFRRLAAPVRLRLLPRYGVFPFEQGMSFCFKSQSPTAKRAFCFQGLTFPKSLHIFSKVIIVAVGKKHHNRLIIGNKEVFL